jgi:phosphopantothenoylcysteine decarboxylase/phosphopantothenate--cysteine ligase
MTALEMQSKVESVLPCDIAICVAAVADWRPNKVASTKIKKQEGHEHLTLSLVRNPDILAELCRHPLRPPLVIGFAAETDHVLENAIAKRQKKGCDLLLANDVSSGVFGEERTHIFAITPQKTEHWGEMDKTMVGEKLVAFARAW